MNRQPHSPAHSPLSDVALTVIHDGGDSPRIDAEVRLWRTVCLAFKTLGVVFGSLVTSPLYVYPSMPLKSPTEGDYLGVYSIMFWTLTLIGVVKYACIAVRADDHGEGGTFALYSLLCRHMKIELLSRNKVRDVSIPQQEGGLENQSRIKKFFERSLVARRVLLFMAILGMCMLIGDGVLTPAISGLFGFSFEYYHANSIYHWVKALSAVILIGLFLLQRFGTSKVSFLFSPILGMWTLVTPLVGIYSIVKNYPSIFKAISPHYIVRFFLRNGKEGWSLLGGTILCITARFIIICLISHVLLPFVLLMAFLFTIYPSLVLTYAGQTAYLIKHPNDLADAFYKFIPPTIYWPIFVIATLAAIVASQSLISATFSVIKQSVMLDYFPRVTVVHTSLNQEGEVYSPEVNYVVMILCVAVILIFGDGTEIGNAYGLVVSFVMLITTTLLTLVMIIIWRTPPVLVGLYFIIFFSMEGVYVSAVVTKLVEGGWIPFAISFILAFIMFGWYHGRQKKLEYELTHKIDLDRFRTLLSEPGVHRVPGVCFFYTNIQDGLTPVLGHYVKNMKSLHSVTIFTTLRYLLVPRVSSQERIIIRNMGIEGVYGCVIHYGYADSLTLEGDNLVSQVIESLKALVQSSTEVLSTDPLAIQDQIAHVESAKQAGVVHIRGKTRFYMGKNSGWFDRFNLHFMKLCIITVGLLSLLWTFH
ncbi:hypothetical protein QQ045_020319 [Rhodiola kirilowii]